MPFVGPEGWPLFRELYDRVEKSNAHRPTHWPFKGIALKWFTGHLPWKSFSPDVLRRIIQVSVTAHVSGCSDFRKIHISFQIPSVPNASLPRPLSSRKRHVSSIMERTSKRISSRLRFLTFCLRMSFWAPSTTRCTFHKSDLHVLSHLYS